MFNELRSAAGNFGAKLLLAFLVLTFAIWGIGDMVRHPGSSQKVATIGKQVISLDTYQSTYRHEMENVRRSLGENYSPELVKNLNIPEHVMQRLINRTLLKQESESLGLIPSDADIVRRIRSNPSFQDSKGNFDKSIFEAALRNAGLTEQAYVEQMRQDLATNLITETVLSSTPLSDFATRTLYDTLEEQRIATLYVLNPSLIPNIPQPDKEQIAAYYNEHQHEFSAPEYRTLSYTSVKADDIRAKATVSESDLQNAYKERTEEFRRPEKRTVEQLLYSQEDKAQNAYKMLQGGTSFAQVAKDTDTVNKKATSLGDVTHDSILDAAADAVFSLKVGEVTQPVHSAFGWHIFHVTAIHPPTIASFEEARPALEKEVAQGAADDALVKFTNKLEDALAGGSTLAEVARDSNLKISTLGPLNREGEAPDGKPAKDIPNFDKFMETAFKTDEKTESSLLPTKGGIYYVVRVDSVTPEHARPLEEVRSAVVASWEKAERGKRLMEFVKTIVPKLSNDATRNATIEEYHLQGISSGTIKRSSRTAGELSLPPELVADIFDHTPGKSTDAYPLKNGNYIVGVVKDVVPVPPAESDPKLRAKLADIRKNLEGTTQNELLQQYLSYLAKKYPVYINQGLVQAASE